MAENDKDLAGIDVDDSLVVRQDHQNGRTMMSDEKLAAPASSVEIIEPRDIEVVFVDWVITAGLRSSVFNLALGTLDHARPDSVGLPKVLTAARLRFSRDFGLQLHSLLSDALGLESQAKEEDNGIPKTVLN